MQHLPVEALADEHAQQRAQPRPASRAARNRPAATSSSVRPLHQQIILNGNFSTGIGPRSGS